MTSYIKKRYFMLDLKDDPYLINEYLEKHKPGNVWPEVIQGIQWRGIHKMQIFHFGQRLFMVMEESLSGNKEEIPDHIKAKESAWETEMWAYQKAIPDTPSGHKWVELQEIFNLKDHIS